MLAAFGRLVLRRAEIPRILHAHDYDLPKGCAVTYDVEALQILERLYPPSKGATAIREWYDDFREANDRRPTALEAYHAGYNPAALRRDHGSWFDFVHRMGDLTPDEQRALADDRPLLVELETTAMTRSYKIVLLQSLLELDALPGSAPLPALTDTFARLADRSAALEADISSGLDDRTKLRQLLRKNQSPPGSPPRTIATAPSSSSPAPTSAPAPPSTPPPRRPSPTS